MLYSIDNNDVIRSNRSQFTALAERENIDLYYFTLMHGDTKDSLLGFVTERGCTYISDLAKAYLLGGIFVISTQHYNHLNKMSLGIDQSLIEVINSAMTREPLEMLSPIDGKIARIKPHYKFYLFII